MRRALQVLALALAVVVVPVTAQQPQQSPPPVFRTGINYVRVDVIASARNGVPVADLKQSDFEVTEERKPPALENFKFIKLDGAVSSQLTERTTRRIRTHDDETSQ